MRKRQEWLTWVAVIVSLATVGINARAQAFGVLHSFTNSTSDGSTPEGQPVLIGSTLYGVTFYGGSSSNGTLYRVSTNGTAFGLVYSFTGGTNGANPFCTLVSTGASFYGMTFNGGIDDGGVIFGLNTNGPVYSVLHTFLGGSGDGLYPFGSLTLNGTNLYGMTVNGGSNSEGVVFSISTAGSNFSVLHSFASGTNDGAAPYEGVVMGGSTLYGTAFYGGSSNLGIVFALNTAVTSNAFTILHHFTGGNADGANPTGPLTLNGSTLYGLTTAGGTNDLGVIFKVNTGGSGYSVLHSFSGGTLDGASPEFGPLVVTNSVMYGATEEGGTSNSGVLFQMNTGGTGFTVMHAFSGGTNDGAYPAFGPLLSGSILCGVTPGGGSNNLGVVYGGPAPIVTNTCPGTNFLTQISAIQIVAGTNVVITVPTVACEMYQLQYSAAMVPTSWTNIGSAVQGTGAPILLTNVCAVAAFPTVTWLDLPWPIDQNWGGSHGSPATTNGNVITLTGYDVLSEQSFSAPVTISYDVTLNSETTGNGAFEFFFVPSGVASNALPNPDVELQMGFQPDTIVVQTNHNSGIAFTRTYTISPPAVYANVITVAPNGVVSWAINGQDLGLGNSVVMPYSSFQIRLSSWQPTQDWYVSNFAVTTGYLQRFYRVQESP
jgi:uncharacterized repeat protein (TIGR03803 family)